MQVFHIEFQKFNTSGSVFKEAFSSNSTNFWCTNNRIHIKKSINKALWNGYFARQVFHSERVFRNKHSSPYIGLRLFFKLSGLNLVNIMWIVYNFCHVILKQKKIVWKIQNVNSYVIWLSWAHNPCHKTWNKFWIVSLLYNCKMTTWKMVSIRTVKISPLQL